MLMLAGIVVLHITTIDNAWWVTNSLSADLWGSWKLSSNVWHYTNLKGSQDGKLHGHVDEEYLQTIQATSVLACIFAILAMFVFVTQLFTLPKGQRFTFTGILQIISCLCIMIAASIYMAKIRTNEQNGGYGHSYVLAWISFAFTFILAITYLILRKKSE